MPHGSGPHFLPWHKVKFSARKNASEGYAYDCGLFHIVAIMDTALLKSGKEGYALGCHALYGAGFQEPIPLHGLKQATVRADAPGRISVLYEDGTVREENGRRYAAYLCGALNDIAQNLAECAGIFARGEEAYRQGDPAQALELFLEAANKDYPPAQVRCGQMYRAGGATRRPSIRRASCSMRARGPRWTTTRPSAGSARPRNRATPRPCSKWRTCWPRG